MNRDRHKRASCSRLRVRQALVLAIVATSIASVGSCSNGCTVDPGAVDPKEVRNFGVVIESKLFRSGSISEAGFSYFYGHGLKTTINLRTVYCDRVWVPEDRQESYRHIPIRDHHPPTMKQMENILGIVSKKENLPALIHCSAGSGRTGIVVAIIRYSLQGWPMEKALEEAKIYHSGRSLNQLDLAFAALWQTKHKPGSWQQ